MKTVVVAGASGFIGQSLGPLLGPDYHLIGLSRSARSAHGGYDEFRQADLFSLRQSEAALKDADYAVYLVHSMMPSARLVQGHFEDLDLLCADNFARAAALNGVKQIIYLGGLLPSSGDMSAHLRSRAEVEIALGSTGVPVTCLRAGLIVGASGSSFQMLTRLVRRLPVMICPAWTQTLMQPVAQTDVIRAIEHVCGNEATYGQTYDLACPDALSYRDLMSRTARAMGLRRRFWDVPYFSPALSRLWVSLTTGAPRALVAPLVKSLTHEMVAREENLLRAFEPQSVDDMLAEVLPTMDGSRTPRAFMKLPNLRKAATVRSVQRMRIPEGQTAQWAMEQYLHWLPRGLRGLLRIRQDDDGTTHFALFAKGPVLLRLAPSPHRGDIGRKVLMVVGGLLARNPQQGRLEFRQVLDGQTLIAAIHEFGPRLPWAIYRLSQAVVHEWVMYRFRSYLKRQPPASTSATR